MKLYKIKVEAPFFDIPIHHIIYFFNTHNIHRTNWHNKDLFRRYPREHLEGGIAAADGGLRRFIAASGLQLSGRQSFATNG